MSLSFLLLSFGVKWFPSFAVEAVFVLQVCHTSKSDALHQHEDRDTHAGCDGTFRVISAARKKSNGTEMKSWREQGEITVKGELKHTCNSSSHKCSHYPLPTCTSKIHN